MKPLMQPTRTFMRNLSGFTLVELMIALTLGLVLIGGIVQIFISTREAYRVNDALARVQETGRIALETLARDFRLSGYSGCQRSGNLTINAIGAGAGVIGPILAGPAARGPIQGYDNGATPAGSPAPLPGTDSIFLSGMGSASTNIDPPGAATKMAAQTAAIPYAAGGAWNTGDILLVADCQLENSNANAFFAPAPGNNGAAGSIPSPGRLATRFATDAVIGPMFFANYLIMNDVDGVPSLFRHDLTAAAPVVIAQGVEDMEFRFGLDNTNDGIPDVYLETNAVDAANWNDVYAVEISLLLRDPNPVGNVTTGTQSYRFPSWAAADTQDNSRFMHAVVSTTVALRNRVQ